MSVTAQATLSRRWKRPPLIKSARLRWQETDRIHAMVTELRKLGVNVVERRDSVEIEPSKITPAEIDTYGDHRVAMGFSLIGLKVPGIRIKNPECVSKTFPTFFDVLETLHY